MIARENSSLRRRSGVRNAAANACSTCPPLVSRVRLAMSPRQVTRATGSRRPPRDTARASRGSTASDTGGAAPGRADLLGCGRGERVGLDVDLHAAELAGAQDLDGLVATHGAGLGQRVRVHPTALREQGRDPVEVDDLEDDLVRALETGELGQPHVQRGLPTLEPGVRVATRAGALGAATGRLALGALAAADSRLGGVGARGGTQVVDLQSHSESFLRLLRRARGA